MTKVLVVSHDYNTKNLVDQTLTFNGFIVHTITKSSEAWKIFNEIHFSFVMIDMDLGDESGLAFYKALRQAGYDVPVIMIGEGKLDEFLLTDLSHDHYDFILKPLYHTQLRAKVNHLLEQMDEPLHKFKNFPSAYSSGYSYK